MNKILLKYRKVCDECSGTGLVTNPETGKPIFQAKSCPNCHKGYTIEIMQLERRKHSITYTTKDESIVLYFIRGVPVIRTRGMDGDDITESLNIQSYQVIKERECPECENGHKPAFMKGIDDKPYYKCDECQKDFWQLVLGNDQCPNCGAWGDKIYDRFYKDYLSNIPLGTKCPNCKDGLIEEVTSTTFFGSMKERDEQIKKEAYIEIATVMIMGAAEKKSDDDILQDIHDKLSQKIPKLRELNPKGKQGE